MHVRIMIIISTPSGAVAHTTSSSVVCRAVSRDLNKEEFLVTPLATPPQIDVVMGMALLFE